MNQEDPEEMDMPMDESDPEELDDEDGDEVAQTYQGVGTNLPDRIFVMNNRDYNLGVANHADKWAVFWLFTVSVSCLPRCLQSQSERAYHRMIRKGKEAAEKEALANMKKLEGDGNKTTSEKKEQID